MAGNSDQQSGTHIFLYNKYNISLVTIQARKSKNNKFSNYANRTN